MKENWLYARLYDGVIILIFCLIAYYVGHSLGYETGFLDGVKSVIK